MISPEATYQNTKHVLTTSYGRTDPLPIEVGLHQVSALSPFLSLRWIPSVRSSEDDYQGRYFVADDLFVITKREKEFQKNCLTGRRSMAKQELNTNT